MEPQKHHCDVHLAKINGRTLRDALDMTKANHGFGKFSVTKWIDICPLCDAYALGIETTHPWPFLSADGIMRTAEDFSHTTHQFESKDLDFCGFTFSESALNSAIALIQLEDQTTKGIEQLGADITQSYHADTALKFSKAVCDWGRGQRVWGNLIRQNSQEMLGKALNEWFQVAANAENDETAISPGISIKGLGVSFASKHLRMLAPQKYAVLDEVLSKGLGFALNTKGYGLFMYLLRAFQRENMPTHDVAALESGIFLLVRQLVRAQ